MKETSNRILKEQSLVALFLAIQISIENPGRNNHNASKLIENITILQEKLYQQVIKFCQKTIFNMQSFHKNFK